MERSIQSFDGTKLYYTYMPKYTSHTLVFLHGVGGNRTIWKRELGYFKKRGFSTLAIDLRGHGKSDKPDAFEKYQLPHFTRDVYEILKKENIKDFLIIGYSLGGAVAINYCMLHKNRFPKSLVLIETSSTYPFQHKHLLNKGVYVTKLLRFIATHRLMKKEHFPQFNTLDFSETGIKKNLRVISYILHLTPLRSIVKTLDNLERYAFNNHRKADDMLSRLRIPILIIAGEKDKTVPLRLSWRIKKLNPRMQFTVLPGASHEAIVKRSREVNIVIRDFFREKKFI